MDVRLPDGTIIRGVPDDISKADLTAKLKSNGYDVSKLEQPAAPSAGEIPQGRTMWEKVKPFVEPTVEALGATGGAILGTPLGPAGAVGGAGLGYGITKEGLRLLDQYLGNAPARQGAALVTEPVKNILEGATMQAGGEVAGRALSAGLKKLTDLPGAATTKAQNIARQTMGTEEAAIRSALRNAPGGLTAAQAAADVNAPAFQTLLSRVQGRTPESAQYITNVLAQQEAARLNELARLAGGTTSTETRALAEQTKSNINRVLEPQKEAALKGANLGQYTQQYATQADQAAQQAAGAVEDVRRFVAAGERAKGWQEFPVPGQPRVSTQITYRGDLAKRADDVANEAAKGSLNFGEAARFNQAASDALASHGIKPLASEPLVAKISKIPNNPEFAGNSDIPKVIDRVVSDIRQWTDNGGVIDAFALDAIRKNSVNAVIRDLYPAADKSTQKELAAGILARVRPAIVDAVEQAGGKGYREYLSSYSDAMRNIAEKKLTGEALRLYKESPAQFVKLVEGNSPDAVEKILGRGNYDIAKELSADVMSSLRRVGGEVERAGKIEKQVSEGTDALRQVLQDNASKLRIPWGLSSKAALGNVALNVLEQKLSRKTMDMLTEAAKSADNMEQLLAKLPASERSKVLSALNRQVIPNVARGAAVNALRPRSENQNALSE